MGGSSFDDFDGSDGTDAAPIQIIDMSDDHRFVLNERALARILERPEVKDKLVVVVSIAGDFRKGKSFMLNFFLRYLQSGGQSGGEWMADSEARLNGFSWRGGSERDTNGILMWSEPFVGKLADGKEVAILLMDTQGVYDSEHTIKDASAIFAMSALTSSIQIFNVGHNIQENDFHTLELFAEYGRLAYEQTSENPFQKLMFLVRDWQFPYDMTYGLQGGGQLMAKRLEIKDGQHEQLKSVRRHIRSCFETLDCYLMPHPGKCVATNPRFSGRVTDMDPEFADSVKEFIEYMLEPNNVVVKQIGGRPVTGKELLEYFETYANIFAGDTLPEPMTIFEATVEASNLTAVNTAFDGYVKAMAKVCESYVNPEQLERHHKDNIVQALSGFDNMPKMGGQEFTHRYREQLEERIARRYEQFKSDSNKKAKSSGWASLAKVGVGVGTALLATPFVPFVLEAVGVSAAVAGLIGLFMRR